MTMLISVFVRAAIARSGTDCATTTTDASSSGFLSPRDRSRKAISNRDRAPGASRIVEEHRRSARDVADLRANPSLNVSGTRGEGGSGQRSQRRDEGGAM